MLSYSRALLLCWLSLSGGAVMAEAQLVDIDPQVRIKNSADGRVSRIEVAAHFVTAIRLPEPVNAVVVGDPTLFQAEHSEQEPQLVFVKPLTSASAETNLLISTTRGRQISLLLIAQGAGSRAAKVDFLVQYKPASGFLIEADAVPFPLLGQTTTVLKAAPAITTTANPSAHTPALMEASFANTPRANVGVSSAPPSASQVNPESLDNLLERQRQAPLPELYGRRAADQDGNRDRLRAGISEVLDAGQQVIVLFSVVNISQHAILLMPPQVQLGGKRKTGKIVKHERWSTAEQLRVKDFRLSPFRVAPGERADGVVLFERPPYKQSNETLFLQAAEAGAVDRPALVPIGFGVSSLREEGQDGKLGRAN